MNADAPDDVANAFPVRVSSLDADGLERLFVFRAYAFRAFVAVLRRRRLLPQVTARVPEQSRGYLQRLPMPWAWMPALVFQQALWALDGFADRETVRAVGRESLTTNQMRFIRPFLRTAFASGEATPHLFIEQFCRVVNSQVRGIEFEYERVGASSGALSIHYVWIENSDSVSFTYWEGITELALELASVEGHARLMRLAPGPTVKGIICVEWRAGE